MSNDTPEPLAAIIAEMKRENRPYGISLERLHYYADRIEAAAERERDEARRLDAIRESDEAFARCARCDRPERSGSAATIREALEEQLRYWDAHVRTRDEEEMRKRTEAALASPARNCDVGTAEEQAERFKQFCLDNHSAEHLCSRCPLGKRLGNDVDMCQLHWAQMPFDPAEGGKE